MTKIQNNNRVNANHNTAYNRTQSTCVLFSPSVYYRNSQVMNSIRPTEK